LAHSNGSSYPSCSRVYILNIPCQADNKPIERADMPSLKVSVVHVPVSMPSTVSEMPTWGEATKHATVTTGRPGGASEAD
jgi:tyrosinase